MTKTPSYRTVLAAVDLSAVSTSVLQHAIELASRHGGRVEVLTVCEDLVAAEAVWGRLQEFAQAVQEEARRKTGERLRRLLQKVDAGKVPVEFNVLSGIASETVLARAAGIRADVIVLGCYGHTRLEKLLLGSTAERVAGQARCPVLMVPGEPRRRRAARKA